MFTPQEEQELRDAFRQTMDYYNNTEVTILITDDLSLDPSGESRSDRDFESFTLPAQVEYGRKTNVEDANMSGTSDTSDVKIFIHLDYVEAAGLLVNNYPRFSSETTRISIDTGNGTEIFRCTHVSVEGAILNKQIYLLLLADREVKNR